MWKTFASVLLLALLSACSHLTAISEPEPEPVFSEASEQEAELEITPELTQHFKQGLKLLANNQAQEANVLWQEAAETWPQFPGVWANLALSELKLGHHLEALEYVDKALALDSQFCSAFKIQGQIKQQQGEFNAAIKTLITALECNPQDAQSAYNLGVIHDLYLQQLPQALSYYQQAKQLSQAQDATLDMWIADLQNRIPARLAGSQP